MQEESITTKKPNRQQLLLHIGTVLTETQILFDQTSPDCMEQQLTDFFIAFMHYRHHCLDEVYEETVFFEKLLNYLRMVGSLPIDELEFVGIR